MIVFVFVGDINDCPYINNYITLLMKNKLEYKIIFWDRKDIGYNNDSYITYNKKTNYRANKIKKLFDFLRFKKFVNKTIKDINPDKLVFLSTLSGFMVSKKILKKYENKYLFEIRDYSYEKFSYFKKMEFNIINKSYKTIISSEGFLEFLPQSDKYIYCHNMNIKENIKESNIKRINEKINIIWNGVVRYYDNQVYLINLIKNQDNIKYIIYGDGPDKVALENYCDKNNIKNVVFKGRYNNNDKENILKEANVINNNYGNKPFMELKYAISNKYYDGIIYGIPQIVEVNTLKSKLVEKYSLGFSIDFKSEENISLVIDKLINFNWEKFDYNRKKLYNKYLFENNKYFEVLQKFLNEKF